VRGYEDESQSPPQIDWGALAKLKGTIVCYTGTRQLPAVLDALLSHGRPKSDSAAIIYNGTLAGQQTVEGTLEELAEASRDSKPKRPSILVVGKVAALRQHLRWFDERPLFGRRIAVTRPPSRRSNRSTGSSSRRSTPSRRSCSACIAGPATCARSRA
jgi:uroporphyrinogen III methyltransferase/synthase